MTRSMDYQGRKHQVVKPVAANDQIATGKMLKPMKSKNDESVPALSSPEKPPTHYDVHTKGPLTYFQFYLDEVVQSANAAKPADKRQSISTTALLGTGFVAATVVSGLLIGDALNKPTAPPDTKIPPVKPKQRAAFSVPRPTSAAPEKLADPRFVPRSQRESQLQAVPPSSPRQNPVDQATPQSFAPMLPSVTLAAAPETLTMSRSSSPKRTVTGAPAAAGMKPLVRPGYQDLPDLQRPPQPPLTALNAAPASAIRETIPTAIAAPERINSGQPAAISPPDPTQPPATPTNSTPFPPAQPSAEASPATPRAENELTAPTPAMSQPANPASDPAWVNPTSTTIESKLSNRAIKTALTENRRSIPVGSPVESFANVARTAASPTNLSSQPAPSRLQDFVTLAQSTPVATRTFMPLTQQAAAEAGQYKQLEKFAIRQVAAQDYQKEWSASSNSDSFGYPAYGFIDYQRQVIVVLTEQPQANPVQSQKATPPNS